MSRHPAYSAKPFFLFVVFPVFLSQHDLQQFSHGIHIAFLPGYLPLSELFRRTVGIIACSRPFFFSVPQASQIQDPHSAVDTDPDIFRLQIPVEKWMLPLMKILYAFRDLIRDPRSMSGSKSASSLQHFPQIHAIPEFHDKIALSSFRPMFHIPGE